MIEVGVEERISPAIGFVGWMITGPTRTEDDETNPCPIKVTIVPPLPQVWVMTEIFGPLPAKKEGVAHAPKEEEL
jgi:hypothetical protein